MTSLPPAPSVGDYGGAAAQNTPSTSSSSPNDIWGLGDLYNQPVFLGSTTTTGNVPVSYSGSGDISVLGAPSTKKVSHTQNQYGTTQDLMQQIVDLWAAQRAERKKNPGQLTGYEQLQQELFNAGFYGQTSYDSIHVGQWTSQTQGAVKAALGAYETTRVGGQAPLTFTDFLQTNAEGGGEPGSGSGGSTRAPFRAALDDPLSIKAAAQSAAQAALGQGMSDEQLNAFVAQFQQAQTQAQRSAYNGNDYTLPDLSSQAMSYAQQSDPQAYKQNQRQSFLDSLANMLAGNSVRPSITPTPSVGG